MKKFLVFVGTMLLVSGMPVYAAKDANQLNSSNIAVVNVQQILQQSPKIADLNKKLQGTFKARQDKLLIAQKSLQEEADKFKKDAATMNEKDRNALQKKVSDDQADFVKQVTAFQQDVNKEQNKAMQGVLGQLNGIISGIAKKNNYVLVLDAQAVVYAADSTDITKQVSKEFDTK